MGYVYLYIADIRELKVRTKWRPYVCIKHMTERETPLLQLNELMSLPDLSECSQHYELWMDKMLHRFKLFSQSTHLHLSSNFTHI